MTQSLCLSIAELQELSGWQRRHKVTEWLRDNGYKYQVGRDGWPRVLRSAVEQRLGAPVKANTEWVPSILGSR